jgi:hypothetical protein
MGSRLLLSVLLACTPLTGPSDADFKRRSRDPVTTVFPHTLALDGASARGTLQGHVREPLSGPVSGATWTWTVRNTAVVQSLSSIRSSVTVVPVGDGSTYVVGSAGGDSDSALVTVVNVAPCPEGELCAGVDQTGAPDADITLAGTIPSGWKALWTIVSGPSGAGYFAHDTNSWSPNPGLRLSGFEDGTWDAWDGDGGGEELQTTSVQSTTKHLGTYAWQALNSANCTSSPPLCEAKLLRWRNDFRQGYYQAWLYWPVGYDLDPGADYINLMQWKERTGFEPIMVIAADRDGADSMNEIVIHDARPGFGDTFYRTGVGWPQGQWVHVAAYQYFATSGELWVWINGELVFRNLTMPTGGRAVNCEADFTPPCYTMFGVGNYTTGDLGAGQSLYWDDVRFTARTAQPAAPVVRFPTVGTYVVRITGSSADGSQTVSDDVTVTVE